MLHEMFGIGGMGPLLGVFAQRHRRHAIASDPPNFGPACMGSCVVLFGADDKMAKDDAATMLASLAHVLGKGFR